MLPNSIEGWVRKLAEAFVKYPLPQILTYNADEWEARFGSFYKMLRDTELQEKSTMKMNVSEASPQ